MVARFILLPEEVTGRVQGPNREAKLSRNERRRYLRKWGQRDLRRRWELLKEDRTCVTTNEEYYVDWDDLRPCDEE